MAEASSKQGSVAMSVTTLNHDYMTGSSSKQSSSTVFSLPEYIYNSLQTTTESIKSTEEICLDDDNCFEFKAIQNPNLHEAYYFEKPGLVLEEESSEELYLRLMKEQKILPVKRPLKGLKGPSIALQYYNLDSTQTRALCGAMLINETVEELNLNCNKLTLDGFYHLGQVVRKSKSLHSLNLQHCKIGPEEVELLVSGLEVCQGLTSLDLSYNEIGDEGMKILGIKLSYNISIKKLNLSHNNLTHESGFSLAETMEENMGLQHLDLSWNQINREPGLKKFLFMAADENENLKILDLSWNGLGGDKIANIVKHFMAHHRTLQEFNLSHNRFETASENIKLAKGINASESLHKVNLSYNGLTANVGVSLLSNISPKAHLRTLLLTNLWVNQDFELLRKELQMQTGLEVIIEGVSGGTEIKGPDMKTLLLKRANFLGYQPKKNKKDFGWFLLRLKKAGTLNPVKKSKFIKLVDEDKIKYDEGMVDGLAKSFRDENKKIDLNLMLEKYLELFPNTVLPEPKEKKKKLISKDGKTPTEIPKDNKESKSGIRNRTSTIRKSSMRETEETTETKNSALQKDGELDAITTLEDLKGRVSFVDETTKVNSEVKQFAEETEKKDSTEDFIARSDISEATGELAKSMESIEDVIE